MKHDFFILFIILFIFPPTFSKKSDASKGSTHLNGHITHTHHICQTESDCVENFMTCRDNHCVCDEFEEESVEQLLLSQDQDREQDLEEKSSLVYSLSHPSSTIETKTGACRGVAYVGDVCDNLTLICTHHAVCNPSSQSCECLKGFEIYNTSIKECRQSYGLPCTHGEDPKKLFCNPQNFFDCSTTTNRCSCYLNYQYDEGLNRCVPPLGDSCEFSEYMYMQAKCGSNAMCVSETSSGNSKNDANYNLYDNMELLHDGRCKCLPDFYPDDTAFNFKEPFKCIPIIGKSCNASDHCESGNGESDYKCNTKLGICECKNPLVYDSEGCKLGVGSKCGEINTKNNKNCTSNAICTKVSGKNSENSEFLCQCIEDFVGTSNGHCQLGYKAVNCSSSPNSCHKESGLICMTNSQCDCPDGQTFDREVNHCVSLHGVHCDLNDLRKQCVEHSECDPKLGVCRCKESFGINENGFCYYGYGTLCELPSKQCLPELGMECVNFSDNNDTDTNINSTSTRCGCIKDSGTIYDETMGACLLKVGESCNYFTHSEKRCIKRAFCGTGDKCQCYSGYSATPEGDCLIDFGQFCSIQTHNDNDNSVEELGIPIPIPCNFYNGLECLKNRCECGLGTIFNEKDERCAPSGKRSLDFGVHNNENEEFESESSANHGDGSITGASTDKINSSSSTSVVNGLKNVVILILLVLLVIIGCKAIIKCSVGKIP